MGYTSICSADRETKNAHRIQVNSFETSCYLFYAFLQFLKLLHQLVKCCNVDQWREALGGLIPRPQTDTISLKSIVIFTDL
jgi:hypothetical protein